jgi:hypothetical protein
MTVKHFLSSWEDVFGDVGTALQGNTQWTLEQIRDTGFILPFLKYNENDYINMSFELPHAIKKGTEGRLHLHYIPEALPVTGVSDTVYWSYAWVWINMGEAIPLEADWNTGTYSTVIDPTKQFCHCMTSIINMTKPDSSESSMILVKLTRLGTNALDTYSVNKSSGTAQANLGILRFDIHVQKEKNGTILEYTNS